MLFGASGTMYSVCREAPASDIGMGKRRVIQYCVGVRAASPGGYICTQAADVVFDAIAQISLRVGLAGDILAQAHVCVCVYVWAQRRADQ